MNKCFIISPFLPVHAFTCDWVKNTLSQLEDLEVEAKRADDEVNIIAFRSKIETLIRDADFIIADITGRNPNVMYELGMAHAHQQPVILITADSANETPADIRHLEYVSYSGSQLDVFRTNLVKAVRNVVTGRFDSFYDKCASFVEEYNVANSLDIEIVARSVFVERAKQTTDLKVLASDADRATVILKCFPKATVTELSTEQQGKVMELLNAQSH